MEASDRPGSTDTVGETETGPSFADPEAASDPSGSGSGTGSDAGSGGGSDNRWLIPVAALAVFFALLIGMVVVLGGDEDDELTSGTASTTTAAPTSTTEASAGTTEPEEEEEEPVTTTAPDASTPTTVADPTLALWPAPGSDLRYDDPEKLAEDFATDFVGFTDPVVEKYIESQSNVGEVRIRGEEGGTPTIVFMRRATPDSWSVFGATTNDIQPQSPPGATPIVSPLGVMGRSTSFDGNVTVQLRAAGDTEPLAETVVPAGTDGTFEPFSGFLAFTAPATDAGAVVYTTRTEDGDGIYAALVLRARFR